MAANTVNLSLSAEQAAILLPLLEQISSTPGSSNAFTCAPQSNSSSPSLNTSNTSTDCYSADELLQKKRKNTKSTCAQSYLSVSLP